MGRLLASYLCTLHSADDWVGIVIENHSKIEKGTAVC